MVLIYQVRSHGSTCIKRHGFLVRQPHVNWVVNNSQHSTDTDTDKTPQEHCYGFYTHQCTQSFRLYGCLSHNIISGPPADNHSQTSADGGASDFQAWWEQTATAICTPQNPHLKISTVSQNWRKELILLKWRCSSRSHTRTTHTTTILVKTVALVSLFWQGKEAKELCPATSVWSNDQSVQYWFYTLWRYRFLKINFCSQLQVNLSCVVLLTVILNDII